MEKPTKSKRYIIALNKDDVAFLEEGGIQEYVRDGALIKVYFKK